MTHVRITSDLHLSHEKVALIRGFRSPAEHDRAIIRNLASGATDATVTIIAGDLALGDWRSSIAKLVDVPGAKHLVLGNHDRAHPRNRNAHNYQRDYLGVFASIGTSLTIQYGGCHYLVSHYPYDGDHVGGGDRDTQWRLRDEGSVLLHGHTHSDIKRSRSMAGTIQIHIGLDAWELRPADMADVARLVQFEQKSRPL